MVFVQSGIKGACCKGQDISGPYAVCRKSQNQQNAKDRIFRYMGPFSDKELHAGYDARIRTLEEKENELLSLCDAYQKHLLAMQRMAQDDPGWKKQLELIQEGLRPAEIRAGIQVTGQAGEKADLSIHEIVDIAQTQDPDMDGKVREVYENGCIYMGKPRKKARVSVWRCGTGI